MKLFDSNIISIGKNLQTKYQEAHPFPHIVLDELFHPEPLKIALDVFPKPEELDFYRYDNPLERKLAYDQVAVLPNPIAQVLWAMNSPVFLRFLEELTAIDGLIPDPYFRGGGIHQILPDGKLDIHIDFNRYTKLDLYRRLNVIVYLNQNWEENYGGHLELWSGHKEGEQHILNKPVQRILPIFNRMVIFSTSERSYHGHPETLTCPQGMSRKSIATYYYTTEKNCPTGEVADGHSTTFIRRPHETDDSLDEIRRQRNRGRLASNVISDVVA